MIGDSGVGKSKLLYRFAEDTWTDGYISTIGVDFKVRTIELDSRTIKLQIWDTAGQERFRTISSTYYRGAHSILIVYDVTNRESFANVPRWLDEVSKYARENVDVLLLGNKADEGPGLREVSQQEGKEFAEAHGMPFLETSAKAGTFVDTAFLMAAHEVKNKMMSTVSEPKAEPVETEKPQLDGSKWVYITDSKRPTIGDLVHIVSAHSDDTRKYLGAVGKIDKDDRDSSPFSIKFDDGQTAGYYSVNEVKKVAAAVADPSELLDRVHDLLEGCLEPGTENNNKLLLSLASRLLGPSAMFTEQDAYQSLQGTCKVVADTAMGLVRTLRKVYDPPRLLRSAKLSQHVDKFFYEMIGSSSIEGNEGDDDHQRQVQIDDVLERLADSSRCTEEAGGLGLALLRRLWDVIDRSSTDGDYADNTERSASMTRLESKTRTSARGRVNATESETVTKTTKKKGLLAKVSRGLSKAAIKVVSKGASATGATVDKATVGEMFREPLKDAMPMLAELMASPLLEILDSFKARMPPSSTTSEAKTNEMLLMEHAHSILSRSTGALVKKLKDSPELAKKLNELICTFLETPDASRSGPSAASAESSSGSVAASVFDPISTLLDSESSTKDRMKALLQLCDPKDTGLLTMAQLGDMLGRLLKLAEGVAEMLVGEAKEIIDDEIDLRCEMFFHPEAVSGTLLATLSKQIMLKSIVYNGTGKAVSKTGQEVSRNLHFLTRSLEQPEDFSRNPLRSLEQPEDFSRNPRSGERAHPSAAGGEDILVENSMDLGVADQIAE